jgi:hypothetical protein
LVILFVVLQWAKQKKKQSDGNRLPAMKPKVQKVPVFAVEAAADWNDLWNAMEGCVTYQQTRRGIILPLLMFAPMTEPENLDAWEPMRTLPENLLIMSIERPMYDKVLQALQLAREVIGEICRTGSGAAVDIDFRLPLTDIYRQMTVAGIRAATLIQNHPDDGSFFFLRGSAAVQAFSRELPRVTG